MATSPLLGAERAARRPAGTSTDLLGPSDSSDSGSDLTGAVGAVETDEIGLDTGFNDDIRRAPGAGADIGDANLDADSDRSGTGERAEAGRDTLRREAPDIAPDRIIDTDGTDEAMVADTDDFALEDDAEEDEDEDDEPPERDKSIDA
jgi:hypothetical protein